MPKALVLGGGGFIGSHMVTRLKAEGYDVTAVDLKLPEYSESDADDFQLGDLRNQAFVHSIFQNQDFNEVYQFAADMGGAGFVFSGDNDAEIMHNSSLINLNVLETLKNLPSRKTKIFYSSSACMYPEHNQLDPQNPNCTEESAYPANPDSEYGWEKLFSERIYLAYKRNHQIPIAIARFHNIYGPLGTWRGGREKAPAAICRKIALSKQVDDIEVWGDGLQTRSFLYIDDCINAVRRLMQSDYSEPVNIGSEEMVTINELVEIVTKLARKKITRIHKLDAPVGVRGRNSDNTLIREVLNWDYEYSLKDGIAKTYGWIETQVALGHE